MSNGYDANGWEREPFGVKGNVRNPEYEFDGPAKWQKPVHVVQPPHGGSTLHRKSPVSQVGLPDPESVLPVRVRPAG